MGARLAFRLVPAYVGGHSRLPAVKVFRVVAQKITSTMDITSPEVQLWFSTHGEYKFFPFHLWV